MKSAGSKCSEYSFRMPQDCVALTSSESSAEMKKEVLELHNDLVLLTCDARLLMLETKAYFESSAVLSITKAF